MGCMFGDKAHKVDFVKDADGEFYDFHIKDVDGVNPSLIVANCKGPEKCKVGDADSGVRFDSKLCGDTVVDAVYKCTDVESAGTVTCP